MVHGPDFFPPRLRESGSEVLGKKEPHQAGSQSAVSVWFPQEFHKSLALNPERDVLLCASKWLAGHSFELSVPWPPWPFSPVAPNTRRLQRSRPLRRRWAIGTATAFPERRRSSSAFPSSTRIFSKAKTSSANRRSRPANPDSVLHLAITQSCPRTRPTSRLFSAITWTIPATS